MNGPSGPDTVRIDGSFGEGGGQILRTSLALSCVLGQTMEITNIRKARKNPGLRPQHRTAVMAAAFITGAEVQGAELSSAALQFRPNRTSGGSYRFDVAEKQGSAGSVSLVLQTILLPLFFAEQPSEVLVKGGTHVPWSPSFSSPSSCPCSTASVRASSSRSHPGAGIQSATVKSPPGSSQRNRSGRSP